jgi:hypothetical protein
MKQGMFLAIMLGLLMTLSGCDGVTNTPKTPPTSYGELKVTNDSSSDAMTALYVVTSGSEDWGSNYLSSSISAGGSMTLTDVPAGTYDVGVVFSSGGTFTQTGVSVASGKTTNVAATPSSSSPGSMKVTNGSSSASMTELYIYQSGSSSQGANQLGSSVSAGGSITINEIPAGTYDVAAKFSDGGAFAATGVSVAADATTNVTATSGGGGTTGSIKITNGSSSYSITGIYLVEVTGSSWGSNLLTGTVGAGGNATMSNVPPGTYDIGIEFSSGYGYAGNVSVSAGQEATTTVSPMSKGALRVVNDSSYTFDYFYLSTSSSSWGTDYLSSTLSPGGAFLLKEIPENYYYYKIGTGSSYANGAISIYAGLMSRLVLQ